MTKGLQINIFNAFFKKRAGSTLIETKHPTDRKKQPKAAKAAIISVMTEAGIEFAFITATPLMLFLFGGKILNRIGLPAFGQWFEWHLENSSLFIAIGLVVALIFSFSGIIIRIYQLKRTLEE